MRWLVLTDNENMELTYGLHIDFHNGWKEIMRFSRELFPYYLWLHELWGADSPSTHIYAHGIYVQLSHHA
jgi:hypothetical protein